MGSDADQGWLQLRPSVDSPRKWMSWTLRLSLGRWLLEIDEQNLTACGAALSEVRRTS